MKTDTVSPPPPKTILPEALWLLAEKYAPGFSPRECSSSEMTLVRFENQAPTRTVSVSQNIPVLK